VRAELYFDRFNKAWTQPVFYDVVTKTDEHEALQSLVVYPNPAGSRCTLSYSLKQKSAVDITLYDLQGKQIRSVFAGIQSAGTHQLDIDASALSAGSYIVKISGNDFTASKLLSVVK
jgi:hypothetical protein